MEGVRRFAPPSHSLGLSRPLALIDRLKGLAEKGSSLAREKTNDQVR